MKEKNKSQEADGAGGVRVDRPVRPDGGEPSRTWMGYIRYLETRNEALIEVLREVDQTIVVEASLNPDKEYGWIEWLNERVRPMLA